MRKNELIYRFFRGPIRDILRAVDGNSQLGAFVLAICTVDYLTYIIDPTRDNQHNGEKYKKALNNFAKLNEKYTDDNIHNGIWELRTCLVHVYGMHGKEREYSYSLSHRVKAKDSHLQIEEKHIYINTTVFITELILVSLYLLEQLNEEQCKNLLNGYLKSRNEEIRCDLERINCEGLYDVIRLRDSSFGIIPFDSVNIDALKNSISDLENHIYSRYNNINM